MASMCQLGGPGDTGYHLMGAQRNKITFAMVHWIVQQGNRWLGLQGLKIGIQVDTISALCPLLWKGPYRAHADSCHNRIGRLPILVNEKVPFTRRSQGGSIARTFRW